MSVTRYRDGDVTVTLDGALQARVEEMVTAAGGETLRLMRAEAQAVADQARAEWYGPNGVTRQTGLSGDIVVTTTVSPDSVTVGLGSSDTRTSTTGRGRAVNLALFVHRPGRLALTKRLVTRGEWWEWKKAGKPVGKGGSPHGADWTIFESSGQASDGKHLMTELVRKPLTARMKVLPDELREAILAKVRN